MMIFNFFLAARPAYAIPVTSTYCFQYKELSDFSDHMVGQGSNFTTNTWDDRGLRVVFDAASPQVGDVDVRTETNDNAGNGNGLPGCVTVELENTTTYTVRLYLDAVRGGNTVRLMVPIASVLGVKSYVAKTSHIPVNGQTYGPGGGWSDPLVDPESRVHAAANFAIGRWTLGVTNKTVEIDLDNTVCGPTSSCMEQSTGRIHISTTFGYDDTYNQSPTRSGTRCGGTGRVVSSGTRTATRLQGAVDPIPTTPSTPKSTNRSPSSRGSLTSTQRWPSTLQARARPASTLANGLQ